MVPRGSCSKWHVQIALFLAYTRTLLYLQHTVVFAGMKTQNMEEIESYAVFVTFLFLCHSTLINAIYTNIKELQHQESPTNAHITVPKVGWVGGAARFTVSPAWLQFFFSPVFHFDSCTSPFWNENV